MDDRARADGTTRIVEVGEKPETAREATAEAWLVTTTETVGALVAGTKKGSPIETEVSASISTPVRSKARTVVTTWIRPSATLGSTVTSAPVTRTG